MTPYEQMKAAEKAATKAVEDARIEYLRQSGWTSHEGVNGSLDLSWHHPLHTKPGAPYLRVRDALDAQVRWDTNRHIIPAGVMKEHCLAKMALLEGEEWATNQRKDLDSDFWKFVYTILDAHTGRARGLNTPPAPGGAGWNSYAKTDDGLEYIQGPRYRYRVQWSGDVVCTAQSDGCDVATRIEILKTAAIKVV